MMVGCQVGQNLHFPAQPVKAADYNCGARAATSHPALAAIALRTRVCNPPRTMSNIGKLMKQAARMQQQIERVQSELAAKTVEATSGGGVVKVTAKCDGSLAAIKIDPAAVNPADVSLLEDMVLSAANSALAQAKEISNAEMGKVTQGFNLPGMM
jgi:nucleoid-associated protein EbfC